MSKPIYVTQPYLPPLEEFIPYLQEIWDKKILTNGGSFHQQLEKALCDYLGVKHLAMFDKLGVKIFDVCKFDLVPLSDDVMKNNQAKIKNHFSEAALAMQLRNIFEG